LSWIAAVLVALAGTGSAPVEWRDWSDAVFEQARAEKRLVLLDVGAVWCHWCHVMDETTYQDPSVTALLRERYIAVRVDQDARPDLSSRYEDYGWPATVIFDPAGRELAKFQGYIQPPRLAGLLRAFANDPTPGPSVVLREQAEAATPTVPGDLRGELERLLAERYDEEHGGWGFSHKFLDWDAVEYSLWRAREGDAAAERRARETLDRQLKLIDPVWGGVYQYSDSGIWESPHFEKIMAMQAENLRVYALAWRQLGDPRYLQAARDIQRYLTAFLLSPDGGFFVSQDADLVPGQHSADYFAKSDAERRALGVPRVDRHVYARETAWAAQALVALHAATGEPEPLEQALRAARFVVDRRGLPGGGFRHDERDGAGPYLGDTLAAGRAFLALYMATADPTWLARAVEAADFIERSFRLTDTPGYATARPTSRMDRPAPQRDENVMLVRFANLLHQVTGQARHRAIAEQALAWLSLPEVARRPQTGGVLLSLREAAEPPAHITVVGPRDDERTRTLLRAALALPGGYKRVEVLDRARGPLPNPDVEYPQLAEPAAFVCAEGRCSRPLRSAAEIAARASRGASSPAS
jgi:uncharacterized protein YyaL (SSP411 family)